MANSFNELFGLGSHTEDSSLLAWLKLQEGSGTTAVDSSSNGNDGTILGVTVGPSTTAGPTNWLPSAIDFDGVDDYVDLGSLGATGDNQTILFFAKAADPAAAMGTSGLGRFGESASNSGATHYPYTDGQIYSSVLRGLSFSSNFRVTIGNIAPALDQWRQVCVKTSPVSGGYKFRVDGTSYGPSTSGITSLYLGDPTWLGRSTDNSVSYWFAGQMAGFAQFQRTLSDAEEAEAFAGPEPLNLTAPTGSILGNTFSGNVGTWDSQNNGTVSCAWELRDADDDSVVASGTAADGAAINATGTYAGMYYLFVRASNDGGYDTAEDQTTAAFSAERTFNELFGLGSHTADTSLLAWLKLQETSGTTAVDSSPNGNDGTYTGMGSNPVTATGPTSWLPSAVSFDGVNDYVNLGVLPGASGASQTLLMYMKRTTDPAGSTSTVGFGVFGEAARPSSGSFYPYTNGLVACAAFRSQDASSMSRVTAGDPGDTLTSWRKVCVKTSPGTGGWKFRLDGTNLGTADGLSTLYLGDSTWIGQSRDNTLASWYLGEIAHVARFNRELSDAEEAEAFDGPEPLNLTPPTGTIALGTTFDGNVGTWDSQNNGTVSCAWELRNVVGDVVEASGTAASGADITASGTFDGSYYLFVRASNDGGYDPAEDQTTSQFTSDGSTVVNADASDTLTLTDAADINYITTMYASDTISLSDMTEDAVVRTGVDDSLAVTDAASVTGEFHVSVTESLAVSDRYELVVEANTSDTLSLTDDASATVSPSYQVSASDTLTLSNTTSSQLDQIALTTSTTDTLSVSDLASCYLEINISSDEELVTTDTEVDPDTLDIIETETGLRDQAASPAEIPATAADSLQMNAVATAWVLSPGGITESVTETLTLDDSGQKSHTEASQAALTVTDAAAGFIAQAASDEIELSDTASAMLDGGVTVTETLAMSDTIASQLIEQGCPLTQMYDTSQAGEYAAVSAVTGFRLRYPATSFTSEVVLRSPNLGNKDRISLQRINRVSRGGRLFIYADPIWPKVETMALTFSALCREDAVALQDFMQLSLGDEIALFDWEDREWRGVITEVQDPIVEDRRNSYSASFIFEGTKV